MLALFANRADRALASAGVKQTLRIIMSVTSVQVTNFPSQISQDEFGKLFSRLDGFLGCRIIRAGNAEYDRCACRKLTLIKCIGLYFTVLYTHLRLVCAAL